nr:hypothetical protein [Acidithiobacillus ferridurans]
MSTKLAQGNGAPNPEIGRHIKPTRHRQVSSTTHRHAPHIQNLSGAYGNALPGFYGLAVQGGVQIRTRQYDVRICLKTDFCPYQRAFHSSCICRIA